MSVMRSWHRNSVETAFSTKRIFIICSPKLHHSYCRLLRRYGGNIQPHPPLHQLLSEKIELIISPPNRKLTILIHPPNHIGDILLASGADFRLLDENNYLAAALVLHFEDISNLMY